MNILVTGGSGFIGQRLCERLSRDEHRISVLTRDPARARAVLGAQVRAVRRLEEAGPIDAIVNLQGENLAAGRWTEARKQAFVGSRVAFTRMLVDWIERQAQRPTVLINASAIGWYGDRGDETLTESSTPADDFAARLCRDWEAEALRAESLGLRVCRLRIGVVLDADGGALAKMLPAFRLGGGGPLGSGRQWMSWITRRDLLRLIIWLLKNETLRGAFNATAPQPLRQRDFARALGQVLHRPAWLPMPAFVLRALFGEMAGLLLGSQRVLPQAALDAGFRFEHADIETALQAIVRR